MTYLALGDSYTIGEGVDPEDSWPYLLKNKLSLHGYEFDEPTVIAKTGWTAEELLVALQGEQFARPFDLVSLLIGVNNQYRGETTAKFIPDLIILVDKAIKFAGGDPRRVFAVSIPDYGLSPFAADRDRTAIADGIDDFNRAVLEVCESESVPLIDITRTSRDVRDGDFVEDGLHPSRQQYERWVDVIAPTVMEKMSLGGMI